MAGIGLSEISLQIAVKKGVRYIYSKWFGDRIVNIGRILSCSSSFSTVILLDAAVAGICLQGTYKTKTIGIQFAYIASNCELTAFWDGMLKVICKIIYCN